MSRAISCSNGGEEMGDYKPKGVFDFLQSFARALRSLFGF
jgi:hypothetical protein